MDLIAFSKGGVASPNSCQCSAYKDVLFDIVVCSFEPENVHLFINLWFEILSCYFKIVCFSCKICNLCMLTRFVSMEPFQDTRSTMVIVWLVVVGCCCCYFM